MNSRINTRRIATNDSEEGAYIAAMDESSGGEHQAGTSVAVVGGSSGSGSEEKPVKINGHLDTTQRRIYLAVFSIALLSALTGLVLILVWMLHFRDTTGFGFSDAQQLANLHPVLMYTFMVSLNMYTILVYRTHFYLPKAQLKWAHAVMSGGNIVMSLLGVLAMYKSHLMSGIPNFYSLHSWIGVTTNAFYLIQFSLGFIAFMKPGLALSIRSRMMPWHRKAGTMILVLAAMAAITGIAETVIFQDSKRQYSKFAPITFIANFAGLSVIVMTIATVYLVTATHYLRPNKPEELPLKR